MADQRDLPESCPNHRPVQHRDRKQPWCPGCGLTEAGDVPTARQPGPLRPPRPVVFHRTEATGRPAAVLNTNRVPGEAPTARTLIATALYYRALRSIEERPYVDDYLEDADAVTRVLAEAGKTVVNLPVLDLPGDLADATTLGLALARHWGRDTADTLDRNYARAFLTLGQPKDTEREFLVRRGGPDWADDVERHSRKVTDDVARISDTDRAARTSEEQA